VTSRRLNQIVDLAVHNFAGTQVDAEEELLQEEVDEVGVLGMDERERRNLHGQPSGLPVEGGDWLALDGGGESGMKRTGWPASRDWPARVLLWIRCIHPRSHRNWPHRCRIGLKGPPFRRRGAPREGELERDEASEIEGNTAMRGEVEGI
jgi:hypothetical protein